MPVHATTTGTVRASRVPAIARHPLTPLLLLGGLMVVWAAVLLYVGRDTDFFFDEWAFIQDRRGWNASAFLDAHNEHLSLVPVALYKAMFMLVGIDSYFPYRMLVVALH